MIKNNSPLQSYMNHFRIYHTSWVYTFLDVKPDSVDYSILIQRVPRLRQIGVLLSTTLETPWQLSIDKIAKAYYWQIWITSECFRTADSLLLADSKQDILEHYSAIPFKLLKNSKIINRQQPTMSWHESIGKVCKLLMSYCSRMQHEIWSISNYSLLWRSKYEPFQNLFHCQFFAACGCKTRYGRIQHINAKNNKAIVEYNTTLLLKTSFQL